MKTNALPVVCAYSADPFTHSLLRWTQAYWCRSMFSDQRPSRCALISPSIEAE